MLTRKQHELVCFINDRLEETGISPSFEEMKEALDLKSKSGVHRLISALEERNFIRRLPNRARALEVIRMPERPERKNVSAATQQTPTPTSSSGNVRSIPEPANDVIEIPLHGRIAAGVPIEAFEGSSMLAVPAALLGSGEHYALEVSGDSMIEAGINDGDVVVIREQDSAENGDIIVALVEGHEATLKRYRRRGAMIALEAANPAYETRILPEESVRVQGRLVGLIRSY